jgi:hypothetical protein
MGDSHLDLKISGSGLANIPASKLQNDFNFIVGELRYSCPWFMADFLSPVIRRLHLEDSSVSEFIIDTVGNHHQFSEFLSLGRGLSIQIADGTWVFFASIAHELGNFELFHSIVDHFEGDINISTVVDRVSSSAITHYFSERIIDFIASNFFELRSDLFQKIPESVFLRVISHPSLQILNEDSLYDIISSIFASSE